MELGETRGENGMMRPIQHPLKPRNQDMTKMKYTPRNQAFIKRLQTMRGQKYRLPMACNPEGSILNLAFKLRKAQMEMHGNVEKAVCGQSLDLKRRSMPGIEPIADPVITKKANKVSPSLWSFLAGAQSPHKLNIPSSGTTPLFPFPQPLTPSECENIMENAINCVISTHGNNIRANGANKEVKKEPKLSPLPPKIETKPVMPVERVDDDLNVMTPSDVRAQMFKHLHAINVTNQPIQLTFNTFSGIEQKPVQQPMIKEEDHSDNSDLEVEKIVSPSKRSDLPAVVPDSLEEIKRSSVYCPMCMYGPKTGWRRHAKGCKHEPKKFYCRDCSYTCNVRYRLLKHMKTHGRFHCMYCGQLYTEYNKFRTHLEICNNEQVRPQHLFCKICDTFMPNKTQLIRHTAVRHKTRLEFCTVCRFSTTDTDELAKHMTMHSNKDLYVVNHNKCKQCGLDNFPTHDALYDHIFNVHIMQDGQSAEKEKKKAFSCKQCSYCTTSLPELRDHMKKHELDDAIRCKHNTCQFFTVNEQYMKIHEHIHMTKSCTYDWCTYKVKEKSQIRAHFTKHLKESMNQAQPSHDVFYCPICTERPPFKYLKCFNHHMETHRKQDACPYCYEIFYTPKLLYEHLEGVHSNLGKYGPPPVIKNDDLASEDVIEPLAVVNMDEGEGVAPIVIAPQDPDDEEEEMEEEELEEGEIVRSRTRRLSRGPVLVIKPMKVKTK